MNDRQLPNDCRPWWSNIYHACHWTPGSRVQTQSRAMDFKGDKTLLHAFFGVEVKPSVSCRKILRHVKEPCRV
jgi:hypothetical protein